MKHLCRKLCLGLFLTAPAAAAAAGDPTLADALRDDHAHLHALYVDLHRQPELHDREARTGARMAAELRRVGFEVRDAIGGHGVLGILRNGDGPTLLLRTVMDALPLAEQTGLEYASSETALAADGSSVPVAHACGHDAMMASAIGAARYLAARRTAWRGTLLLVAQPADETILGARTMIADGLLEIMPRPDYVIGYHLLPEFASNQAAWTAGPALAGCRCRARSDGARRLRQSSMPAELSNTRWPFGRG